MTKDHETSEFEAIDLLTTVYLEVYITFRGFTLSKLGRLMFIMTIRARPGSIVRFYFFDAKKQEGSYAMHPAVQDRCTHLASTDKNVNMIRLKGLILMCWAKCP